MMKKKQDDLIEGEIVAVSIRLRNGAELKESINAKSNKWSKMFSLPDESVELGENLQVR